MGFKVQLTAKEASSKVLEPIPMGWYKVTISEVELKEVTNPPAPGKPDNRGKPYYAIEHTVSEGDYEGRKVYSNAMLFEGALYTAVQLVYGITGVQPEEGELEVPEPEELIGKELYAKVKVQGKRKVNVGGEQKEFDARNDIAGYKPLSADVKTGTAGRGGSLLPS